MTTPAIIWPRSVVLAALDTSKTLGAAAKNSLVNFPMESKGGSSMSVSLPPAASRAPHTTFIDMTDREIRNVTVQRRAENQGNGNAAWFVRCPDGHEFVVHGIALRAAEKNGHDIACPGCKPTGRNGKWSADMARRRTEGTSDYQGTRSRVACCCSVCGVSGHTRATCPQRRGRKARICRECSNLAHRIPVGESCPVCGLAHAPERMPTIDDVMAQPHVHTREVNF